MLQCMANPCTRQAHGAIPAGLSLNIEKPYGQILHTYTFIVTTMEELVPYQMLQFYCGRVSAVSSSAMTVNANRLQSHVMVYNLFSMCGVKTTAFSPQSDFQSQG